MPEKFTPRKPVQNTEEPQDPRENITTEEQKEKFILQRMKEKKALKSKFDQVNHLIFGTPLKKTTKPKIEIKKGKKKSKVISKVIPNDILKGIGKKFDAEMKKPSVKSINFFAELKARKKFSTDYQVCEYIVKVIIKILPPKYQSETYADYRTMIIPTATNAAVMTSKLTLAWYNHHYKGEPSKLIKTTNTVAEAKALPMKQKISLILSLLHSGYTSKDGAPKLKKIINEILSRRKEFAKRVIAGKGVNVISIEDSDKLSPLDFTNLAKKMGSKVLIFNPKNTKTLKNSFLSSVAKSNPKQPLTITVTLHGMSVGGGYVIIPPKGRLTPKEFAQALKKRGNLKNVTILSTQCYPRSKNKANSFYDQVRKYCKQYKIGVPAVYMESTADQAGIMGPSTPDYKAFQTLRHATDACKTKQKITGADILKASMKTVGNQPSMMVPPTPKSKVPLNDDLAYEGLRPNATTNYA